MRKRKLSLSRETITPLVARGGGDGDLTVILFGCTYSEIRCQTTTFGFSCGPSCPSCAGICASDYCTQTCG